LLSASALACARLSPLKFAEVRGEPLQLANVNVEDTSARRHVRRLRHDVAHHVAVVREDAFDAVARDDVAAVVEHVETVPALGRVDLVDGRDRAREQRLAVAVLLVDLDAVLDVDLACRRTTQKSAPPENGQGALRGTREWIAHVRSPIRLA
jgi:hypothetical protein